MESQEVQREKVSLRRAKKIIAHCEIDKESEQCQKGMKELNLKEDVDY